MADIETINEPMVTITLREYNDLLLEARGIQLNNLIARAVYRSLIKHGETTVGRWSENYDGIKEDGSALAEDILRAVHAVDPSMFACIKSGIKANEDLKKEAEAKEKEEDAE